MASISSLAHRLAKSRAQESSSNVHSRSSIKTGNVSITLAIENLKFVPEKEAYEIDITDAYIISTNPQKKSIKILLGTSSLRKINRELSDSDIDELLDEIETQNEFIHNRDKTAQSLQARNIKKEWSKIATKQPATFTPSATDYKSPFPQISDQKSFSHSKSTESTQHTPVIFEEQCSSYLGQCVNIKRLIFIQKYYHLWREYKTHQITNISAQTQKSFESMTHFLHSLSGYNGIHLMNDYLHVRKCHFSNDLIGYFKDKIECESNDSKKCVCVQRLSQSREIYALDASEKNDLYFINSELIKQGSMHEIREINLQRDLDVIHCGFIHDCVSADLSKYISEVDMKSDNDSNTDKSVYDEFGIYFDYWKENRKDFCKFKYSNLKSELLNSSLYKLCWNDFNLVYERAKDYLRTDFMKYSMNAKREFDAMKGAVKYGQTISIDHLICVVTYTNYKALQHTFIKNGCKKLQIKEKKQSVMVRNSEIAHWCRLLKESVYYFGDLLHDSERLYHGISQKLRFQRVAKKFNLPMSTTTKHSLLQSSNDNGGIVLVLNKMFALEENNLFLDTSFLSDYPNECERVIYGGRLGFVDIIYDRNVSHLDTVMSLRLYQKLIDGDWFTKNDILFQKKYQTQIAQMIQQMMSEATNDKSYMQQLFECIVCNVGFGTKTIWLNMEECAKLIPELSKLFFEQFLPYLRKYYKIRMKYCSLMNMKIKREALESSSRQYQLYSAEFKYECSGSTETEIELHFRCYKQFDSVKNMHILMAKFEAKTLPKEISSVKMYGGLWFPQIAFDRWDYCTLSHQKLSQGCPLFSLDKVKEIDTLRIEICFQLYRVYDQFGKRLKL